MRTILNINKDWSFVKNFAEVPAEIPAEAEKISIPHTWNNIDGLDGVKDPYLYTAKVNIVREGAVLDSVSTGSVKTFVSLEINGSFLVRITI